MFNHSNLVLYVSSPARSVAVTDFSIMKNGANFGDELNFLIAPKLFGEAINAWHPANRASSEDLHADDTLLVAVGSLMNNNTPVVNRKIVFGAGFGYGTVPRLENWDVLFTRGPISNMILGLNASQEAVDAAYVLALMGYAKAEKPKWKLIIPHYKNPLVASLFPSNEQATYVLGDYIILNPLANVDQILALITDAEYVIAEAMHGAIVADAMRVPWVAALMGTEVNELKWHDWLLAFGERYEPLELLPRMSKRSLGYRVKHKMKINVNQLTAELLGNINTAGILGRLCVTSDSVLDRKLDCIQTNVSKLLAK